ncbi:MAG TPA: methionine--tRNA ligase [Actinobacteria bacterium]|nr:methionine--tRNA ligase [bacterium BMS3Bbin01]HDH26331.1 methionine--tRNA ligase [Actinomycetota bacterium]
MNRFYVTTAIPYVNASPHLGHALELVQADVLARYRRQTGDQVRFLSGTDDNALKNVLAAEAAGVSVEQYVEARADEFESLRGPLALSLDDYIRTSTDVCHRGGVERLWEACARSGDLYTRSYEGLYCVGCEQFYAAGELSGGTCPEHGTTVDKVAEHNWFFRLSRHEDALLEAIGSGRLRIEPEVRRNEVVSFIQAGLEDISVSRPAERARGWGIPVPGDQDQVVYIWYDALGNYISALGYGMDSSDYRTWWLESDERVHVIGKGILRFHAVHWPAFLLSAGEPLPTAIFVHDYLTVGGAKISKSAGPTVSPADLVDVYGSDALRWWLAAEVPRVGDADFTEQRLVDRINQDLVNGYGNLLSGIAALLVKYRGGRILDASEGHPSAPVEESVARALARFDLRTAALAVSAAIRDANAELQQRRPWELARLEAQGDTGAGSEFDRVLGRLVTIVRGIAWLLAPFTPQLAERARTHLGGDRLTAAEPLFPRLIAPE